MSATPDNCAQRTLFEAEAYTALQRATGQANMVDLAMMEAAHGLEAANLPRLAHEVQRAREQHRLFLVRLSSIRRRAGEGAP